MRISVATIKGQIVKLKKHGLGDVFISSVFTELIGFIASVFIVRAFSKEAYGYYAIAYNIYGYIAVFVGCGLNNAVLQYCSETRPNDEKKSIYQFCLKFGSVFNVILLALMPFVALITLNGMPRHYFITMSGWPFVAYLSNYFLMRLRVIKDNRHFMLSNVISATVFLICAFALSKILGIIGYIVALYIKYVSSALLSSYYLKDSNNTTTTIKLDKKFQYELIKYSLICCLTNFASTIMMLVDVTCVNYFIGDPSFVATYKTATQIPTALMFIPTSVIVFAFPYLAENNTNIKWLKSNTRKLTTGVFAINFVVSSAVFLLAPIIVRILWGEKYLDAVQILRILTINFLVTGTFNKVYGNLMVAVKKVNINLLKTVIFSCLNVILDVILIRFYGSTGAAIATLIVSIGSSAFSYIYYHYWIKKRLVI